MAIIPKSGVTLQYVTFLHKEARSKQEKVMKIALKFCETATETADILLNPKNGSLNPFLV